MKRTLISGITTSAMVAAMVAAFGSAPAEAAKERVIHSFNGSAEGAAPEGELYRDAQGNLYGTNETGGSTNCGGGGCGTVFKVAPNGNTKVLHVFVGSDGAFPNAGVVADSKGNLYGTAYTGGTFAAGTVWKVAPNGRTTLLYNFTGGTDGAGPFGAMITDGNGNFYGTTTAGGAFGNGTVFKINTRGIETMLYSFAGGNDGVYPLGTLLRDSTGNLYGVTGNGGTDCDGTGAGCGTVFKLSPTRNETVLYRFAGGSHGANPAAGITMDESGTIYGTTNVGGIDCDGTGFGCGNVFKLMPDGRERGIHVFQGGIDGALPKSRLVLGTDGFLYGTTAAGGDAGGECGCGIVFRMTTNGREKILYTFKGGTDGHGPLGGLVTDGAGNFFGTTNSGGVFSSGTLYRVSVGQ